MTLLLTGLGAGHNDNSNVEDRPATARVQEQRVPLNTVKCVLLVKKTPTVRQ